MFNRYHISVIPTYDETVLLLYDHSVYTAAPDTPVYDIVSPGMDSAIRINANAEAITAVNALLLFGNYTGDNPALAALADGVYQIIFRVRPYDSALAVIYDLRTTAITQLMDDIYAMLEVRNGHPVTEKQYVDLMDAEMLLRSAEANCRLGNTSKASSYYQDAWRLVEKVNNFFKHTLV